MSYDKEEVIGSEWRNTNTLDFEGEVIKLKGFFPMMPYAVGGRMFLAALTMGLAMLFLFSALLMWLWNITIPRIFNVREITFWEAFRILIIAGILFGDGLKFNFNF